MSRWGRGWEVGINKEIDRQFRDTLRVSELLANECGKRHKIGSRVDLCGKCAKWKRDNPEPSEESKRGD